MPRLSLLLLAALSLGGCAADAPVGAAGATMRDSVGVRVVENTTVRRLRLAEEPLVSIGAVEGDAPYLFGDYLAAVFLEDGGLAVAELEAREVRFFDAEGRHLRTVGGEGGGPGEFRNLGGIDAAGGDRVVIRDGRWTWISASDGLQEIVTDPRGPLLAIGDSLGVRLDFLRASPPAPGVITRDTVRVIVYRPGEEAEDTVAALPWVDVYFPPLEVVGGTVRRQTTVPFGRTRKLAAVGQRIATGSGESFQVELLEPGKGLVEVWRRPWTPQPVTDAMMDEVVAALGTPPPSMAGYVESVRMAPRPDHAAAFDDLRGGPDGSLWVRHKRVFRADPVVWSVFAPDGSLFGELTLPADVSLEQGRMDRVLVVWQNDLDVSFVRVYAVEPADRAS